MFLQHLYLRNFRNYEEMRISFGPKINLIQGPNAQGKTNLLEALYFLSTGKSFRSPHLQDLIRHSTSYFYLEAEFIKNNLSETLKVYFDGKQRKIHYNNTSYPSFANLLGLFPAVIFAPEDISLIAGSPSERRRFLNLHIAQTDPLYVHHLIRYSHAMKQRNQLLKQKNQTTIDVWEEIMACSAAYLIQKRKKTLDDLNPVLENHMRRVSSDFDTLNVKYCPSLDKADSLEIRTQLQKLRPKEIYFGSTLTGPHRDDMFISINNKEAKTFSSEGQKRSCISAVRLAEWLRLKELTSVFPLMCIDDFGVHLDSTRHSHLQNQLQSLGQVFLTSPFDVSLASHKLYITEGKIS